MASVAPSSDQAADLLQELTLNSKTKMETAKKTSVDGNLSNGQPDKSITPLLQDPMTGYWYPSAYFYSGYDASGTDSEAYKRYLNSDGVEMNPGAYGENGSLVYPHGYGYPLYGPYSPATSPVPTMGQDGQTYGAQHYQYPNMYYPSLTPSVPYPNPVVPAKAEKTTSLDHKPMSTDSKNSNSNVIANGGSAKGNNGSVPGRYPYQNSFSVNGSDGRGGAFDGLQSPYPWFESPYFSDAYAMPLTSSPMNSSVATGNGVPSSRSRHQNFQPHTAGLHHPRSLPGMNTVSGYMNGMYSNKYFGYFGYGLGYGSNYSSRINGRGWMSVDGKYKPRGRGNAFYGNENLDGLNELNRGPRGNSAKNPKAFNAVALAVKGHNIPLTVTSDVEKPNLRATPDREHYNKPDFPETYTEAKCFVIKSYSEDDVHKSIKYNVWSSTPNGNKKLDAAYLEAQQKSDGCPVFLFFSVNTSGQFVGVAEMVGPVDFDKNVEYWQQDKWVGCFPVKWHIVKDVPNTILKHIILEYNENKPVTNSRDTQEVKLAQGLEMLKIFKDYTSNLCILDDFDFYEDRQKRIQEKKAKQQLYQKQAQQVLEDKTKEEKKADSNEDTICDVKTRESSEITSNLEKEATTVPSETLPDKNLLSNGVANGC